VTVELVAAVATIAIGYCIVFGAYWGTRGRKKKPRKIRIPIHCGTLMPKEDWVYGEDD